MIVPLTLRIILEQKSRIVPEGMVALTIPSKPYAAFTHRGPMEKAESSYCQAWQWMSEHGLKKDHGVLGLERFDQRYQPFRDDPGSHHNEFDLYIPILEHA